MSNENLQMQVITDAVQKSCSNVQFVSDSPITDPGTKVIYLIIIYSIIYFVHILKTL